MILLALAASVFVGHTLVMLIIDPPHGSLYRYFFPKEAAVPAPADPSDAEPSR
jgi:hypothetical protein